MGYFSTYLNRSTTVPKNPRYDHTTLYICLKDLLDITLWVYDTFDNSLRINNYFKLFPRPMRIFLFKTLPTNLIQIFCKINFNSKAIVKKYDRSRRQFLEERISINGSSTRYVDFFWIINVI